jgi:hypothetical protein
MYGTALFIQTAKQSMMVVPRNAFVGSEQQSDFVAENGIAKLKNCDCRKNLETK